MKKLLILLCLTLGFSQTKLETRVYPLNLNFVNGAYEHDIDLIDLVGIDLNYAIIKIVNASNFFINDADVTIYIKTPSSYHAYFNIQYDRIVDLPHEIGYSKEGAISLNADYDIKFTSQGNPIGNIDLLIAITAEFPEEDTGYIEEGFEFCVEEGVNLTSFPCENDVALTTTFPQEALNNISSIVGQGEATINNNGQFFGSLQNLKASKGYWIISNSAFCYNYTCAEN